nr:copia protein [Tanacetum cinerariifolium]
MAYGKIGKAADQAFGLLKVNSVPSGLVSISPAPDPSTHDDPSVNSVHGSCRVSITDSQVKRHPASQQGSLLGCDITCLMGWSVMTTIGCAWKYLCNLLAAQTSARTSFSIGHDFIPSGLIMYPRNIPSAAPNVLTNLSVKGFVYQSLKKTAQAKEIADLKKRVKKLERKRRSRTSGMNLFKIEHKNVNEALGDESWIVAMQEELNQFINVWELVPQPKNMTIIGTKWVFRNELDENGIVSQNKARLVPQGYNQQEDIDYDETYAPVARLESIRILLAYVCALDFKLFQMDVKSAFLNGFINDE